MANNRPEAIAFCAGAWWVLTILDIKFKPGKDIAQEIRDVAKQMYPDYDPETDHVEKNSGGSHRPLRIPRRG